MKYLLIILLLLISLSTKAQTLEVIYKETHKLDKYQDNDNDPEFNSLVRKKLQAMDSEMKLSIHLSESLYALSAPSDKSKSNNVYKNFTTKSIISQENILERKFIIDDTIRKPEWILSNAEKEICGIKSHKATNQRGDIAWFSKDIPIGDGPYIYYGLPGLILEIENDIKTITAQQIIKANAEDLSIQAPSGSKKVSREEFTKIQKQKLSELGADDNSSGVKIIKM